MCREIFWKRIVPLFFSFFLGFIVVAFVALQEIPSIEVKEIEIIPEVIELDNETRSSNLRSEKRNCIPADPHLKYIKLDSGDMKPEAENSAQTKKSKNERVKVEELPLAIPESLRESIEEIEKQIRESSKDYITTHNLLYTEYCFESNGRR